MILSLHILLLVTIEITIPPEITRLGAEAVAAYEKALEEGKRKIPYCSMLILGDSGVGKTSLYRQLVGLKFREDLKSTEGIDNNTVDTMVDERSIAVERSGNTWHQTEVSTGEVFARAAGEETRLRMPKKKDGKSKSSLPSEKELLQVIKEIKKSFKPPIASPSVRFPHGSDTEHLIEYLQERISLGTTPAVRPSLQPIKGTSRPKSVSSTVDKPKTSQEPKLEVPKVAAKTKEATDHPNSPAQPSKHIVPDQPHEPLQERQTREPAKKEEPKRQSEMQITRRDSSIIAGVAKGRTKHDSQEKLTLNALDFAGQPEYRPMHHCFITRRACYLVVFKLPDMVAFIPNKDKTSIKNVWEELIYWVHSINAHIYPPDANETEEMNKYRRIVLIGTHKNDVNDAQLKCVDEFISDKIENDKRCVNHVSTFMASKGTSFPADESEELYCPNSFIAVENSIDFVKRKIEYLAESGTKSVQAEIEHMSSKFSFLEEEYPIKWLKFKEKIEVTSNLNSVVTDQEMKEMANASRIVVEEQQALAIKFLHDSGKIICLGKLKLKVYLV